MTVRYVRQNQWIEIKKKIWDESITGNPICVYCKKRNATQLAHAIFYKRYGKKHRKLITVEENACPCCEGCQKFSETKDERTVAWIWLCKKFGASRMKDWYENMPQLIKETIE